MSLFKFTPIVFLSCLFTGQGIKILDIEVDSFKFEKILHQESYSISPAHPLVPDIIIGTNVPLHLFRYEYDSYQPTRIVPQNGVLLFVKAICEDSDSFDQYDPEVEIDLVGENNCEGEILTSELQVSVENNIGKVYTKDDCANPSGFSVHWDENTCDDGYMEGNMEGNVIEDLIKKVTNRLRKSHSTISRDNSRITLGNQDQTVRSGGKGTTPYAEEKCTTVVEVIYDACRMIVNATSPIVSVFENESRDLTLIDEDECTKNYACAIDFPEDASIVDDSNLPVIVSDYIHDYYNDDSVACLYSSHR